MAARNRILSLTERTKRDYHSHKRQFTIITDSVVAMPKNGRSIPGYQWYQYHNKIITKTTLANVRHHLCDSMALHKRSSALLNPNIFRTLARKPEPLRSLTIFWISLTISRLRTSARQYTEHKHRQTAKLKLQMCPVGKAGKKSILGARRYQYIPI